MDTPESSVAPTQTLEDTEKHPVISRLKDGKYPPGVSGYPAGRPKGAKNRSTRIREALVSQVGRETLRRFRHRLNSRSSPREFEKALDQVIALLGPGKPLVAIDQSTHSHMTVVLDGSSESAAA